VNGVRVSPGATQLTVIPCAPSGLASVPLGDRPDRLLLGQIDRELAFAIEDRHLVLGLRQRADDRSPDSARSSRDHRRASHECWARC
jgi:hypothetical protein